jgi:hypothetical protein
MTDVPVVEPAVPEPKDMEAARALRRAKRQFTDDDSAPTVLRSSGVPHEFWPSRAQFTRWWPFVESAMGSDDEGWWYAICPVHDTAMEHGMSAMISFRHGMLRCLGDAGCHEGKTGMTLTNAVEAMADRMFKDEQEDDGDAAPQSV